MSTTTTDTTPRVWIGSLAAYNAGDLLGDWFEAIDCPTDATEWVTQMIARGQIPAGDDWYLTALIQRHEEIWVFDHDNFLGLLKGECSPSEAQRLAQLLDDVQDDQRAAFGAWVGEGNEPDTFEDHFHGVHESFRDYLNDFVPDVPDERPPSWDHEACARHDAAEFFRRYFDWAAYVREMEHEYTVIRLGTDQYAVFSA